MYPSAPKSRARGPVMPSLFDAVYDNAPESAALDKSGSGRGESRVEAVHDALTDSARHWIDLGKPIAVAVAKAQGKVTAETFRAEASKRGKLRPEEEQRSLSYIPVMFAELCKEGHIEKRRHANGKADKEMAENGNEQCVYLPVPGR